MNLADWNTWFALFTAVTVAIQSSTPLLLFVAGFALGKMLKKINTVDNDTIPTILGCTGFMLGGILLPARYTTAEILKGELFGMVLMWASVGLHQSLKCCLPISPAMSATTVSDNPLSHAVNFTPTVTIPYLNQVLS